jgi:hypothetical protein
MICKIKQSKEFNYDDLAYYVFRIKKIDFYASNKQSIVLKCFDFIWNLLVRAKNSVNYYEYPVDIRNSSVAANIDKNGIYYLLLNI